MTVDSLNGMEGHVAIAHVAVTGDYNDLRNRPAPLLVTPNMNHLIDKLKKAKRLFKQADDLSFDDLPESTKDSVRMDEAWSGNTGYNRYTGAVDNARNGLRKEAKKLIDAVIESLEHGGIELPDPVMSSNKKEIKVGQFVERIEYPGSVARVEELYPEIDTVLIVSMGKDDFGERNRVAASMLKVLTVKS